MKMKNIPYRDLFLRICF